ncbi:MAG: 2'-5' RNA ligase family protein [Sphingomonas sp.]
MASPCPLYLMAKPSAAKALEIDRLRRALDIGRTYGAERLHMTLLRLWDGQGSPASWITLLCRALASLDAPPFEVRFERVRRNALVGGAAMRDARLFQQRLVQFLAPLGLPVPEYAFKPHLSLAYGASPERNVAVPPICWIVEELLLIRSIHGQGRHEELGRWPLVPRQGAFGF